MRLTILSASQPLAGAVWTVCQAARDQFFGRTMVKEDERRLEPAERGDSARRSRALP